MTVAELIDHLRTLPPAARVVVPHFNGGLDDVVRLYPLPIQLGVPQFFGKGTHAGLPGGHSGRPFAPDDDDFAPDETAVVIDWSPYDSDPPTPLQKRYMPFQTNLDTRQRTQEVIERDTPVTISATMTPEVAEQIAQFAKRSLFDMFYELTEAHLPHEERQRCAYLMISGIKAVAVGLRDAGYSPR